MEEVEESTLEDIKVEINYTEEGIKRMEMVWGDGFLSPGGAAEVARLVGTKEITGSKVLDIGSGQGGPALALLQDHGVGAVIGIDVQQLNITQASQRVQQHHLADRIRFQLVEAGPFPFADDSFDAVFSKDALIHVPNKAALYAEILRVLRPGGRLLISDWLRCDEGLPTPALDHWNDHKIFFPISLGKLGELVSTLGFVEIELEDRHVWYREEARRELQQIEGTLKAPIIEAWGEEAYQKFNLSRQALLAAVDAGEMRPGFVRAVKKVA